MQTFLGKCGPFSDQFGQKKSELGLFPQVQTIVGALGTQQHKTPCYVAKNVLCCGPVPDMTRFWRHNTVCYAAGYIISYLTT